MVEWREKWVHLPSGTLVEWRFIKIILHLHPETRSARWFSVQAVRSVQCDEKAKRLYYGPLPEYVDVSDVPATLRAAGLALLEAADRAESEA